MGVSKFMDNDNFMVFSTNEIEINANADVEWNLEFEHYQDKLECSIQGNIFRVKCLNDYALIGKTFVITATSKHSSKSITVEVISL